MAIDLGIALLSVDPWLFGFRWDLKFPGNSLIYFLSAVYSFIWLGIGDGMILSTYVWGVEQFEPEVGRVLDFSITHLLK